MITRWEDPSDYPNKRAELEAELDSIQAEFEEAKVIGNRLIIENMALQGEVERLTKENAKFRDALEDILDECKDEYDLDPDPTGGHHDVPNRWMRIGTSIEETLYGPGYVG